MFSGGMSSLDVKSYENSMNSYHLDMNSYENNMNSYQGDVNSYRIYHGIDIDSYCTNILYMSIQYWFHMNSYERPNMNSYDFMTI